MRAVSDVRLEWRSEFTDRAVNELHAEAFGHDVLDDDGLRGQVEEHSLGWVCARDATGGLIGFVNVAWDGDAHAQIQAAAWPRAEERSG